MLLTSSKCPLPALVSWCRTLKHSISAGLDPIRIFRQQAKSGPYSLRMVAQDVAERLGKGSSLEDAFEAYRNRFPPLFLEMITVGEKTGRLEDTFRELESYYSSTLSVQREFRSRMVYPAMQYFVAVLVISALIFVLGMLGSKMDALGIGLTGTSGAVLFLLVTFGSVGGLLIFLKVAAENISWRAKMEGAALILPAWGPALQNFALHRFCIALRMCSEAGLRAEETLHFCFRAIANSAFQRGQDAAIAVVKKGGDFNSALTASRAPFPADFRNAIEVAEETGQISEVTERLAESYREEGSRKLKAAAEYTSYAIYAGVSIMIIVAIFAIAQNYLGAINNATKGF